ncbi:MAG: YbbR-like domain-containing protein [Anaerolineaceae bacterium]|jgi:YbbR domain-containing protein
MKVIRKVIKFLPTFLTALILAIVVWVSAVTSTDPNEELTLAKPVPITILGLDPDLVIVNDVAEAVDVTIRAPHSIHLKLAEEPDLVRAFVNLSGLTAGSHTVDLQVSVSIGPTEVTEISPSSINFTLENMLTKEFPITLKKTGSLPISYEAGDAKLSAETVQVIGPETQVQKVTQVVASVDLTNITTSIAKSIELKALDSRGVLVNGINLNPSQVPVEIPIKQLGGYRNVFIKIVTTGQVARGFYLTGILVDPPTITIYSTDPELVDNMPAYIETVPVNLNGAETSFESIVALNLPEGIVAIGEQTINIEVGVAAIESSLQLVDIPVEAINVSDGLKVTLSPAKVDIYLSGPLYLLEQINSGTIKVTVDLTGKTAGTYQLTPTIILDNPSIQLDSIVPGSIEVILAK